MSSSLLAVGGLVSGIDTNSLISGLVSAYSVPKTLMKSQLDDMKTEKEAFAGLNTRLKTLQTSLEDVSSSTNFLAYSASSSSSAVAATASAGVAPGAYTVKVNRLATRETEVSDGFASKSAAGVLGSGTFSLTYGSTTTDIAVDDTMSLDDLVTAINDQADGVTAYLMNTGDATSPYRLVVTGDDTGADSKISFDTSTLTGTAPTFTEVATADDAEAVINGVTVYDGDNALDGVIPGLSFTASATGSATVQVEPDTTAMGDKLKAVVDAYNDVRSFIDVKSAFDADASIKGPFVADGLVATITNQLGSLISSSFSGFGNYKSLSQLGISTQQDGSLEFDADAFTTAYKESPDDVLDLVTKSKTGFAAQLDTLITHLTEDDGSLDSRNSSLTSSIDTMDSRISDFEDRASAYEDRLRAQFAAMEVALGKISASTSALSALFSSSSSSNSSSSSS
jgi:flagellar hook-associated protein 2